MKTAVKPALFAAPGRASRPPRSGAWARVALLVALLPFAAVGPLAAQTQDDAALRARVEAALASAADLPADSIAVQARNGVVTLTGSVLCDGCGGNSTPGGPATVQQSLGAVVRAVPGVERVEFRLRYAPE